MPLPRTLLARITLVVVVGMVIAQALTFMAIRYERGQAMQTLMISGVERDIASSIAVLDRVPASERAEWLDRLEFDDLLWLLRVLVAPVRRAYRR